MCTMTATMSCFQAQPSQKVTSSTWNIYKSSPSYSNNTPRKVASLRMIEEMVSLEKIEIAMIEMLNKQKTEKMFDVPSLKENPQLRIQARTILVGDKPTKGTTSLERDNEMKPPLRLNYPTGTNLQQFKNINEIFARLSPSRLLTTTPKRDVKTTPQPRRHQSLLPVTPLAGKLTTFSLRKDVSNAHKRRPRSLSDNCRFEHFCKRWIETSGQRVRGHLCCNDEIESNKIWKALDIENEEIDLIGSTIPSTPEKKVPISSSSSSSTETPTHELDEILTQGEELPATKSRRKQKRSIKSCPISMEPKNYMMPIHPSKLKFTPTTARASKSTPQTSHKWYPITRRAFRTTLKATPAVASPDELWPLRSSSHASPLLNQEVIFEEHPVPYPKIMITEVSENTTPSESPEPFHYCRQFNELAIATKSSPQQISDGITPQASPKELLEHSSPETLTSTFNPGQDQASEDAKQSHKFSLDLSPRSHLAGSTKPYTFPRKRRSIPVPNSLEMIPEDGPTDSPISHSTRADSIHFNAGITTPEVRVISPYGYNNVKHGLVKRPSTSPSRTTQSTDGSRYAGGNSAARKSSIFRPKTTGTHLRVKFNLPSPDPRNKSALMKL